MPGKHAVLSASSSKQWLHCPPSARLQENFPGCDTHILTCDTEGAQIEYL